MTTSFFEFLKINKGKTFRPKKRFPPGTLRYNLHKTAQATLHSGIDLKQAVLLPNGENLQDWIAVHVVDFFNRINLLYGTISDFCTEKSCPTMCGGVKYEYLWKDGSTYKKPTKLSAPQYISLLMDWVEAQINDDKLFPADPAIPFPKSFSSLCKKILTRLFRVFVHVYIHHFEHLRRIGAEAHVNTCYKHFYYFVVNFNMVEPVELEPLSDMTERLINTHQLETHDQFGALRTRLFK